MARVNIDILGISELKLTGMGEFNSDDYYIYYCGQESIRRYGVALIVNKSPKFSTWVQSQKWQNDLCFSVRFWGKPFNIRVIQVYALTTNAEEAEVEWFYEDLQDLLDLTPKKDVLFILGDWNAKEGSRDTWSKRQVWPWSIKWSRAKGNRVLSREHTDLNKHPLWTTQAKILHMGITRCSTPKSDRLYLLQPKTEKLYTGSKNWD